MSASSDWCSRGQCPRCRYKACGCPCHDDDPQDHRTTNEGEHPR